MGRKWLAEITDETGGYTVAVDKLQRLPEAAGEISWKMRNQYVLGYQPLGAHGKHRKLKIRVVPGPSGQTMQAFYRHEFSLP